MSLLSSLAALRTSAFTNPLISTLILLSYAATVSSATTTSSALFQPTAGATWNIELDNPPTVSQANDASFHVWDYDLFDASTSLIQAFQAKGHPVICYYSAGTWENWRPDAKQFPKAALGKPVSGWNGERWLNTSNPQVREIMAARIKLAQSKGCDGVDPDNIDGYENPTGFSLTQDQGVDYVQFLTKTANSLGLASGLKNGGAIIDRVVDICAWSVNEQCVQYNECKPYQAFIKQNKPVFHLEYTGKSPAPKSFIKKSCGDPQAKGFSTLIKHLSLNAWTTTCS